MATLKDIVSFIGGDNNISDVTIDDFNCVNKCFKYPQGVGKDVYIYYDNDSLDYPQCDPPYAFVSHFHSYRSARPDIIKAVGAYINDKRKKENKRKMYGNNSKLLQMIREKLKDHFYKGESTNQYKYTYYVSIPLLDVLGAFGTGKSGEFEHRQQVIDLWTNKVVKEGKEEEVGIEETKEEIKEEEVGDFIIVHIDIPFDSTNLPLKDDYIQIDLDKKTYIALKSKCVHVKNKNGKYDINKGGHLYGINDESILVDHISEMLKTIVEHSDHSHEDIIDIRKHFFEYIQSHYYIVVFNKPLCANDNTITLKSQPNPNVDEFSNDTKSRITCLKITIKPIEDEKKFAAIDDDNQYNVKYLPDTIYQYKNISIISTELNADSLTNPIGQLDKLPMIVEVKETRLDLAGIWGFNILIPLWYDFKNRKMYNLDLKPENIMFKNTNKFLKRKWKYRGQQYEYIFAMIDIKVGDYGNTRGSEFDSNTVSRYNGTGRFRDNNVTLRKYIAKTFGTTIAMIALGGDKYWKESKFQSVSQENNRNERIKLLKKLFVYRNFQSCLPLVYFLSDLLCPVDDDRLTVEEIMDHSFWYEPWKSNELSIVEITMKIYFGYDPSILNDTQKLKQYKESHPLLVRVLENLKN